MTPFEQAARAAIATRLSARTKEAYLRALTRWMEHCAAAQSDPADPRLEVAAAFRDGFAKTRYKARDGRRRSYKTSTVRDHLAALSFVYRRLVAQRPQRATWNPFDPSALAWPPVSKVGRTDGFSVAEGERMIGLARQAGATRDEALLELLFSTGARRAGLMTMRRDGLRRRDGVLVGRLATKGTQGADLSELVIPDGAATALQAWLKEAPRSTWVFPGRDPAKPLDLSMANKVVAKWGERAGIPHAHPHRFRVAFITAAFDAKLPWRDIQASAHHEDPRSTLRYDRGERGSGVADAVAAHRRKRKDKERP